MLHNFPSMEADRLEEPAKLGNFEAANDNKEKDKDQDYDESKLSAQEVKDLKTGRVTFTALRNERLQIKKDAEAELDAYIKSQKVTDINEYRKFKQELEETESPDRTLEIFERIKDLPKEREKNKAKEEEEARELPMDHPEIRKHLAEIHGILKDENVIKWIGTKQVDPFEAWCRQELAKKPSIKTAHYIIDKLQHDRNGLKPRQELFERELQPRMKQYDVEFNQMRYLKEEGLTERQEALDEIGGIEKMLEGMRNTGLYSFEAKRAIMQKMLKADDMGAIRRMAQTARDTVKNESEQFTSQESSIFSRTTVNVNGRQLRAMSKKSVELFLADYKHYDLDTREKTVLNWEKIIDNEGKLLVELGKLYKDDPDGFERAVRTFELLGYTEKEQALKDHEQLIEDNEKETMAKSQEMLNKGLQSIDQARSKKTLSDKTAKEFRTWAGKIKDYTDPKTGKIDLKKQEKRMAKMTDPKPSYDAKNRNIAAYEALREKKFMPLLKKFEEDNPEVGKQEIKDWQDKYDEGSFSERKAVYQKLKKTAEEKDLEREENKRKEAELNIDDTDKQKAVLNSPKRGMLIEQVNEVIADKEITPEAVEKALAAIYLYLAFTDAKIENDPELKGKRETLEKLQASLGRASKIDKSQETEMREEAKKAMQADTSIKNEVDELNYIHTINDLAEESERRHGGNIDNRERSRKEAIGEAGDDVTESLIEDFYKQADDEFIVRDDTGEEMNQQDISDVGELSKEEREDLKQEAYAEQGRNYNEKTGSTKFEITDESDRVLSKEEREDTEEERTDNVVDEITDQVIDNAEKQNTAPGGTNFADLTARIAARRAAEAEAKEKIESTIERS